ncbi:MAG: hypothetical protein AAGB15_08990 [Pseudomonadota bacterium]
MRCHPLLQDFEAPRSPTLGPYHLEVLAPKAVQEDYAAVIESTDRLTGFMGGTWPRGLTLEANGIDLCWHAKEFDLNRSFAWIVRNAEGIYQGCAYIFPDFGGTGAQVSVWIRSSADPETQEAALVSLMRDWLAGPDWPNMDFRFTTP